MGRTARASETRAPVWASVRAKVWSAGRGFEVAEEFMPIIHLVFSNRKNWFNGIHHGVSAKHLQAYLNELTFRFNRRFYPFNAFRSLLGIAGGAEAPTYAELYSGEWKHPTCSGCLH